MCSECRKYAGKCPYCHSQVGWRIIKAESAMLLPPGRIAALRGNTAVWVGKLGDPIEDIDGDGLLLSPDDYEELQRQIGQQTNMLNLARLISHLNRRTCED